MATDSLTLKDKPVVDSGPAADGESVSRQTADTGVPVVSTRGLTRKFGERAVLNRIDLGIGAGEFVALLGRSGSGKSTLLRALAGLDNGTEGEITVPARRSVAFQDSRLLPWQRVLPNVTLGLDGEDPVGRAKAALDEVGLIGRESSWPKELSGGEQQRVSLARALVRAPEFLLADEPFGALDALTKVKMHGLLHALLEKHRPAVLLVTHDIDEAILLADRILVLDEGNLATDLNVDSPHPRSITQPGLAELRETLLAALGVEAAV